MGARLAKAIGLAEIADADLPRGEVVIWEPTREQRRTVETCVGIGMPPEKIAKLILRPDGRPLPLNKFRDEFAAELDRGSATLEAQLAEALVQTALSGGKDAVRAADVLLTKKFGWRETKSLEVSGKDGAAIEVEHKATKAITDMRSYLDGLAAAKQQQIVGDRKQPTVIDATVIHDA
jgi:hypothetical protein